MIVSRLDFFEDQWARAGIRHSKLAALVGSPLPLYWAWAGNGHKGRVAGTPVTRLAVTAAGAVPRSTQSLTALSMSK
jgi:hypothetical protein